MTTDQRDALAHVESAVRAYDTAREMANHLRAERDRAIHAACLAEVTQEAIGDVVGLKREQVRLIRDAVTAGHAGQPQQFRPRRRRQPATAHPE